ncbi:MAG TPA: TetR/AcrR family transcriptional regulator [Bacteroidales bacterium]|nr:TetR/AcrR family transcriptional regulator [Bacteroidales bacterium]
MSEKKIDRRVKYTKKVLRQAILDLLKEKPINKITVKEICSLADVNRGTFYSHYYDTYDLLEQIENDFYNQVKNAVDISLHRVDTTFFLKDTIQIIYDNSDLCKILFSEYGNQSFIKKIINIAKEKSMQEWETEGENVSKKDLAYLYTFVSSGVVGIIQSWVISGLKEHPEEIALIIEDFSNSLKTVLEKK